MTIYSEPERFGLEIFAEVEKEPDYDFDKFVMWRSVADGALLYATDSGCSCPSPFESFSELDLTLVNRDNFSEFARALWEWNVGYSGYSKVSPVEVAELHSKVWTYLSEQT